MKNLKQLCDKYGYMGALQWGGKPYHEINSDIPLYLNSYSAPKGFILNENEEVEVYCMQEKILVKRHYYSDEEWETEVNFETEHFWDEMGYKTWWGKTLDNYYPHPWYPEKEIIAFEVIRNLPYFTVGKTYEVVDDAIQSNEDFELNYWVWQCLEYPEFFKPLYK